MHTMNTGSSTFTGSRKRIVESTASHCASDKPHGDSTQLMITIKNGIATISGSSDATTDATCAESLLAQMSNVRRVINLVS